MLKNINVSCPNLRTPAQAQEFGEAKKVMKRVHDVADMCADKNDVRGYDLDTCPDTVTVDRLRFNRKLIPRTMSRDVGRSYPTAGHFTGVVNFEKACECDEKREPEYVNMKRQFGGSSSRRRTETFQLEEVNGEKVYSLRVQDDAGNDTLKRVTFNPNQNTLSYELNPKDC